MPGETETIDTIVTAMQNETVEVEVAAAGHGRAVCVSHA